MPTTTSCFSYPADAPPSTPNRSGAPSMIFGLRRMHTGTACFRYQADVPLSMPAGSCFSYPPAGNHDEVPSAPPGAGQIPVTTHCFRY